MVGLVHYPHHAVVLVLLLVFGLGFACAVLFVFAVR